MQILLPLHWPQSSTPPQSSEGVPHLAPSLSQVAGKQPQVFGTPLPPHVFGAWQVPQSSVPPHPSGALPQVRPSAAHVFFVQTPGPHLFAPPPPHTSVPLHVPQFSVNPQPSGIEPQLAPFAAHVVGLHWHLLAAPLAAVSAVGKVRWLERNRLNFYAVGTGGTSTNEVNAYLWT